jgi:hypothetical protein
MRQQPSPSLAMVLTVRDEERFLAANLAYHHAMGVSRAYVFLDRCTDASWQIAQSFPWVRPVEHDRPPGTFMRVYQNECAEMALEFARAEGFEWLMHLDADEFAFGEACAGCANRASGYRLWGRRHRPETTGSLPRMLQRLKPTTEQVRMPPMEVIPTPLRDGEPFWKLRHFQVCGVLERPLLDPTTGEIKRLDKWLSYRRKGKSIVRTSADVRAADSHRWTRTRARADARTDDLSTEYQGSLYHFVVVSAAHWREKYRKLADQPSQWPGGGRVHFPKQAWKEASLVMSEAEARAYYDRWVVVQPRRLIWPLLRGDVVRDTVVETVLAGASTVPQPTAAVAARSPANGR